jgi:hypothetical protein
MDSTKKMTGQKKMTNRPMRKQRRGRQKHIKNRIFNNPKHGDKEERRRGECFIGGGP